MQLWISGFICVLLATSTTFANVSNPKKLNQTVEASTVKSDETELRLNLRQVAARGHRALGYDRARIEIFGNLYLEKNSSGFFVHDVYCEKDFSIRSFKEQNGVTPDVVPSAKLINTEHTWPQSHFGGSDRNFQKSDLHHLFPSDSELNSIRGSFAFGEVVHPNQRLKCPISAAGSNKDGDFVFEPPEGHRGNVARALFYFAVRYNLHIDATEEAALRKWNQQDEVTDTDRARNDEIERLQGNRNPFIDQPELVDRIGDF